MKNAAHPVMQSVDDLIRTAVGLESPAILLTEAGANLSVILCDHFNLEFPGELHLHGCHWVSFRSDSIGIVPLPRVVVSREANGIWEARDGSSGRLIPRTGTIAYLVHFLEADRKRDFDEMLSRLQTRRFIEEVFNMFRTGAGFRFGPAGNLVAPGGYGDVQLPATRYVEIPDEFRLS